MKSTRRSFLRASAFASLWTAGGCAGFPAIVSSRSPNSKLCHAAIGTANMANYDLDQFLKNPDVEVTAICDVDRTFLEAAKTRAPNARVYTDWRELLAEEGDRIDSVNVSTPDHTHTIIAANAMRAGKHVYCQKPLCKRLDECRLLRTLAATSGVVTQLGTQFAATGCDRQAVAALQAGVIGPVRRVMLFSTRGGKSRAKREIPVAKPVPATLDWEKWIGPAPMRAYAPIYHPLLWRMFTDFGSGWVGDLCIHVISAPWQGLRIGETQPLSVEAKVDAAAKADPAAKGCWPRYSHIRWAFPGIAASAGRPFDIEWFSGFSDEPAAPAEFLPPSVCADIVRACGGEKLPYEGRVIEGEDGYLLIPHGGWGSKQMPQVVMKRGKAPVLPAVEAAPTHFDEFVARCREGGKARSDFGWSARMMETVILGGVAEQIPDRPLRWDAANSTFDYAPATALLKSSYRKGWELAGL